MAIAHKPQSKVIKENEVTAVINRGGSVSNEKESPEEKQKLKSKLPVVVHIPGEWLKEIDESVEHRRIKISRHTWLLEAIAEKLDTEKADH